MVTGGIEILYSSKNKEDKSNAIAEVIKQSGATITHIYIPEKDRRVNVIYELVVKKEQSLDEIRQNIMKEFKKDVENVTTLVDV
jgi:hypothetical protein